MDPAMTLVIAAIIAAIILVLFNKQQENKVSNKMYTVDVRQLYLLTAAEYKINTLERLQRLNVDHELAGLITAFKSGEIQLNKLNEELDCLLSKFNASDLAQVC
ncbi:hypothetical protein [Mucilaginibacter sp.]|uniref:hypothetical protein n=1 Tax=Mucilaginibacter sp. TaxID=1882438 RepID=UPI0025D86837|nr:hypothetical protein [Mucilaginibacter sp.]